MRKKNALVEDNGMDTSSEETDVNDVEKHNVVESKEEVKLTEMGANEEAINSPKSKNGGLMLNDKKADFDALSSSLGRGNTVGEDEKSLGSSNYIQSPIRVTIPFDEASTTVIMETQDNNGLGSSGPINKAPWVQLTKIVVVENIKDAPDANLKEVDLAQFEVSEEDSAPIQSAVKSLQGKKKRKNINDILGFSKVKPVNTKSKGGGRNKNKSVVLRSPLQLQLYPHQSHLKVRTTKIESY